MNYYNVTMNKSDNVVTARLLGGYDELSDENKDRVGILYDSGIEDGWWSIILDSDSSRDAVEDAVIRLVAHREANP